MRRRWSARSRRSSCTRTSARRPGSRRSGPSPPRRSATRPTRPSSSSARCERSGLSVEVLSGEAEARYGYLAAINSTTLSQGVVLDLGGGSMQLTRVEEREAADARSWPLGAVRMTERFLPDPEKARRKQIKALREHVAAEIDAAPWVGEGGRLTGIGGTVRNLAAAAQLAAGLPSYGIQGFRITRARAGRADRALRGAARLRARAGARHQGRARGPDPRRRAGRRHGHGGRRLRRAGGDRRGPARGRLLRVAVRRPAAGLRRARGHGAQPRRPVRHRLRARRARRPARAGAVGRAGGGRRAPRRPEGARAAVGGGDAARHRHRGRLRRPPQALPLPAALARACPATRRARSG